MSSLQFREIDTAHNDDGDITKDKEDMRHRNVGGGGRDTGLKIETEDFHLVYCKNGRSELAATVRPGKEVVTKTSGTGFCGR